MRIDKLQSVKLTRFISGDLVLENKIVMHEFSLEQWIIKIFSFILSCYYRSLLRRFMISCKTWASCLCETNVLYLLDSLRRL